SAGPAVAQTAISTSADGLRAEDIKIAVEGGQMPGYAAMPEKPGKRPVVIVVPEIFGMHRYQQDICRRLAKLGYFAVTLDPYFRKGDLAKMTDIKQVLPIANALEDKTMLADLDALVLSLNRMLGTTFVVISHELPSIFAIADRFIMLDRAAGTIIADGVPADLRDHASNEKVKAFMNRIPTPTPTGSNA
ncbi:MAG: hypothetical protein EBR71_12045, partial [Planctomycetes bacterium]|nr:hypothetical protein [Planctomycetota bacterium]